MHQQFTMTAIRVVDLDHTDGAQYTLTTANAGTRTGAALAPNACALANYHVDNRYRGGKGKTYLPFGVTTDLAVGGVLWLASAITAFQTGWAAYLNAIATNGSITTTSQIVRSYFKGPQPNPDQGVWDPRNIPMPRVLADGVTPAPVPYPVRQMSINSVVRYQDERLGKS
jgi:hypothetical protein